MVVLGLLSCFVSQNEADCTNNAQCDGICIEGQCVLADCITSLDCALQEYCQAGECQTGCAESSDCLAGQQCSNSECIERSCRTAQLDCDYGEDCIENACQPSDFPLCHLCGFEEWQNSPNGEQECILYNFTPLASCLWPSEECHDDSSCYPTDGLGDTQDGYCLQSFLFQRCSSDASCPRPFVCKHDVYSDGSDVNVCWADCPFWRAQGVFE
jgi:hypothetical protein